MSQTTASSLYQRHDGYLPRIAAVHDLCGYGNCSLGVAIPVLSAAGIDVCPVPTSLFSAHTGFANFYMHDTTSMLGAYLDAWKADGVDLDGVYSGFLGSAEQVAIIKRLYAEYPRALHIVDPVMGDGGAKYPTYTDEMCEATKGLVADADVLTPNLTEASILTGVAYSDQNPDDATVELLANELLGMGAKSVILKGIVRDEKTIRNYVCTPGENGAQIDEVTSGLLPFMLHGTGDLYASGVTAAIFAGQPLEAAASFASQLVHDAMECSRHQPDYQVRGVSFEGVLGMVTALLD